MEALFAMMVDPGDDAGEAIVQGVVVRLHCLTHFFREKLLSIRVGLFSHLPRS